MKKLLPFILEMLTFLFCLLGILIGMFAADFFEISIRPHFLSFAFCVILTIVLLWLFVPILSRGIKALIDAVFRLSAAASGSIVSVTPMEASVFTEKWARNHETVRPTRFCYVVKSISRKNPGYITLISPQFIEYEPGQKYTITYSKFSKILLEMTEYKNGLG